MHRDGRLEWRAPGRVAELVCWGLVLVVLAAITYWLATDAETYVLRFRAVVAVPIWVLTALAGLVAVGFLVEAARPRAPWFQEWSFVEVLEEGQDLRLFAGRLGKDHPGVLVRAGEMIELAVTPGAEPDGNLLRVWSSGGALEVQVDVYLRGLTYAPLAAAAEPRGITVKLAQSANLIPVP